MSSARHVTERLTRAARLFTRVAPDEWRTSVEYASGVRDQWGIKQRGEHFLVEVHRIGSPVAQRARRVFYELGAAQTFVARFIRADGDRQIEAATARGKFQTVRAW